MQRQGKTRIICNTQIIMQCKSYKQHQIGLYINFC